MPCCARTPRRAGRRGRRPCATASAATSSFPLGRQLVRPRGRRPAVGRARSSPHDALGLASTSRTSNCRPAPSWRSSAAPAAGRARRKAAPALRPERYVELFLPGAQRLLDRLVLRRAGAHRVPGSRRPARLAARCRSPSTASSTLPRSGGGSCREPGAGRRRALRQRRHLPARVGGRGPGGLRHRLRDAGSFFCTGQLLTTRRRIFTPYYLTANHCIGTAAEASLTEFFWLYPDRGLQRRPAAVAGSVPRSGGAALRRRPPGDAVAPDYSLLMVEGALPDDLFWAGWTGARPCRRHGRRGDPPSGGRLQADQLRLQGRDAVCTGRGTNAARCCGSAGPTAPPSRAPRARASSATTPSSSSASSSSAPRPAADGDLRLLRRVHHHLPKVKNALSRARTTTRSRTTPAARRERLKAGTLSGRIVKIVDPDWYKISVPAGKTVTVHAELRRRQRRHRPRGLRGLRRRPSPASTGTATTRPSRCINAGTRAATPFGRSIWTPTRGTATT